MKTAQSQEMESRIENLKVFVVAFWDARDVFDSIRQSYDLEGRHLFDRVSSKKRGATHLGVLVAGPDAPSVLRGAARGHQLLRLPDFVGRPRVRGALKLTTNKTVPWWAR